MYNAYFIQHSLYLHHPTPIVLSHCPSYYYSVAFQGRFAQVLQIYGNIRVAARSYGFCFEMKILPFSGILSEVRSIVEITKGVQSKILDHQFLKLWTYQPPSTLLSLSLHAGADTQALFTQCLPVEYILFFFRFLFIQILIDHYPLSKEEFNKNSSGSHFEYSLMECTHVLSPMMPDKCGIDEDFYKQPFVFQ